MSALLNEDRGDQSNRCDVETQTLSTGSVFVALCLPTALVAMN